MLKKLDWSHDNIVGYEASGKLTKNEHLHVNEELEAIISKYGKLRLLVRLSELVLPEIDVIPLRIQFAKKHMKDIERFALVSNIVFFKTIATFFSSIKNLQFRAFSLDQEAAARAWLEVRNHSTKKHQITMIALSIAIIILLAVTIKSIVHLCKKQADQNKNE